MKLFILLSLTIAFSHLCLAQMTPVNKKIDWEAGVKGTDIIIEGYVINSRAFNTPTSIFTSDSVRITKIFKGDISDSIIEVVFMGGNVDGSELVISDGDNSISNAGIYFLKSNTMGITNRTSLKSYTTPFGSGNSIRYENSPYSHKAIYGKFFFDDLEKELFQQIEAVTGQKRKILAKNIFGF